MHQSHSLLSERTHSKTHKKYTHCNPTERSYKTQKMASAKRQLPSSGAPEAKKAKVVNNQEQQQGSASASSTNLRVVLNPADCNLDFNIEGNGLQGWDLHEKGFAYCWSGARATVGITGGKYCFGCKIVSAQPVDMEDTPVDQQNVCRLGISRGDNAVGNLGETLHSFGYGGTGKFSNAGKFSDYGDRFGVGDTIICCVDLESENMASIGFSNRGKWLGVANRFDAGPDGLGVVDSPVKELDWGSALFPHVLLKNVVVQMLFSVEDGLIPEEGYQPWACAIEDGKAIVGPGFSDHQDCELMMMVGLPASGKTTWAEKWVKEHPGKRYILLGTNLALEQMKVPGLLRKNNYGVRFERLMDRAIGIFRTLLSRASRLPRNFIIDQTNVYKSARKRKLKLFLSYNKIAVVIFPSPEELKFRAVKRFKEMGNEVPAEAVNEMLANFALPMSKDMPGADEYFDQVLFPELCRTESQRQLEEMKAILTLKTELLPYSHESFTPPFRSLLIRHSHEESIESYPSLPSERLGYIPGLNAHWSSSYTLQVPQGASQASNYSSSRGNLPVCDFNQNANYSGYTHPWKNAESYGLGNPYSRTDVENRNFVSWGAIGTKRSTVVESYQGLPPSMYNMDHTLTAYASRPVVSPPDFDAPGQPGMLSTTSMQYSSYGTPIRGPPYGNYPSGTQPPQGYGTPLPGYN